MKASRWILFLVVLTLGFISGKSYLFYKHKRAQRSKQVQRVPPKVAQKSFVVIISSEGNAQKTLRSALQQEYKNYRIVFLDNKDAKHLVKRQKKEVQFVKKTEENINSVITKLRSDEIIVLLQDNRWFAHDHVLEMLNTCYANEDIWIAYGKDLSYPDYSETSKNSALESTPIFYSKILSKKEMQSLLSNAIFPSVFVKTGKDHKKTLSEVLFLKEK